MGYTPKILEETSNFELFSAWTQAAQGVSSPLTSFLSTTKQLETNQLEGLSNYVVSFLLLK
jgi:hypothetical protein